jgi:hypothetical protein
MSGAAFYRSSGYLGNDFLASPDSAAVGAEDRHRRFLRCIAAFKSVVQSVFSPREITSRIAPVAIRTSAGAAGACQNRDRMRSRTLPKYYGWRSPGQAVFG